MSTVTEVKYLMDCFKGVTFREVPVPRKGFMGLAPGQGSDGYGRKISTDYMARINNRWHRVYCVCYSNSGSLYVILRSGRFYIRDFDMQENTVPAV